ncbi:hypothetical protein [Nostoc sp.]|uniref:hypothetical protein n=1 Tax=Nostoc sp. TaxID=1180 RepID=UPI002FF91F8A
MRTQGLPSSICLWLVMSFLPIFITQLVRAQINQNELTAISSGESFKATADSSTTNKRIRRLSEIERPAINASGT